MGNIPPVPRLIAILAATVLAAGLLPHDTSHPFGFTSVAAVLGITGPSATSSNPPDRNVYVSTAPVLRRALLPASTHGVFTIDPSLTAAAPEVEGNAVTGGLSRSGNSRAPTNGGLPNSVTGARSGQCGAPGF